MSNDTYAHPSTLVSTEWVAAHSHDANVRLAEVDVDVNAYASGHIAGAAGWNWQTQLGDTIRRDIPTKDAWEALLGSAGITADTHLIFYGDNNNWFAAYAYWVARVYGHRHVSLMNGGRKKWELENRPLVVEVPEFSATTYHAHEPDLSIRAYAHDVRSYIDHDGRAMVDVRSPAEFTGQVIAPPGMSETAQRAGHIPSATNIPWAQAANEDGSFKSHAELVALYGGKGITADKEIVAYCRIGERSSHTWFVLRELLGYKNVRNYDGSWTEWGNLIGAPIANPFAQQT